MRKPQSKQSGFSLIELVAAVAIILVLAGVVVPAISGKVERARVARATSDLKQVADAFNTYKLDTGLWPSNAAFSPTVTLQTDLTMLSCLYQNTYNLNNWGGPYFDKGYAINGSTMWIAPSAAGTNGGILDPWGRPYVVFYFARGYNGSQGCISIVTKGPDGVLTTTAAQAWGGTAAGDDLVQTVTRRI